MDVFYTVVLTFFAMCGVMYLARDGWRLFQARLLKEAPFVLVTKEEDFDTPLSANRAALVLSAFLTRPEAKYLVRETVLLTKDAPQDNACGATENEDCFYTLLTREEFIRRLLS